MGDLAQRTGDLRRLDDLVSIAIDADNISCRDARKLLDETGLSHLKIKKAK